VPLFGEDVDRTERQHILRKRLVVVVCFFIIHHSCGTPLNTFICRLPVGDADDEHRILEKKFIKPNGVCGEYRPNTSKRRLDYPWAEYHSDYLDWDDDKVEKKL